MGININMNNNSTNSNRYSASTRPRFNPALLEIALDCVKGLEKQSFVPAPPQQPGGMPGGTPMSDPSAMGAGPGGGAPPGGGGAMPPGMPPPMDPSQMGMAPPPMDPSQAGMPPMPPPGAPPMGGAENMPMGPDGLPMAGVSQEPPIPQGGGGGSSGSEDIKSQIKSVLEETGVIKPQKLKPDDHYQHLLSVLKSIAQTIGAKVPDYTPTEGSGGAGKGSKEGGGSGSSGGGDSKPIGGASTEALSNAGINPVAAPDPGMFAPMQPPAGSMGQQKAATINDSLRLAYSKLRSVN